MRRAKMKNTAITIIGGMVLSFLSGCMTSHHTSPAEPHKNARMIESGDNICLDTNNGLMWQIRTSESFPSWNQAHQYTEQLDAAGFDDWRLPSYEELQILRQTIDLKRQGNCPIELKGSLWSGNTANTARAGFWDSEPLCGGPTYFFIKRASGSVIAVRSSRPSP